MFAVSTVNLGTVKVHSLQVHLYNFIGRFISDVAFDDIEQSGPYGWDKSQILECGSFRLELIDCNWFYFSEVIPLLVDSIL